jgi:hypothetical protein
LAFPLSHARSVTLYILPHLVELDGQHLSVVLDLELGQRRQPLVAQAAVHLGEHRR